MHCTCTYTVHVHISLLIIKILLFLSCTLITILFAMVTECGSDLESEDGGGTFRRGGRGRTSSLPTGQLTVAFEPGTAGLPPADDATAGKVHVQCTCS